VSLHDDFRPNANPPDLPIDAFLRFERELHDGFRNRLDAAIAAQATATDGETADIDHARHLAVLRELSKTFIPGNHANLYYEWEKALPTSPETVARGFNESLVRLRTENGGAITPKQLFEALEDEHFGNDLATSFRLWNVFASIAEYNSIGRTSGLSVNIVPRDMDSAEFRETLDRGIALFKQCGFAPLILEATEYDPWKRERRLPLQDIVKKHGLTLAIDDYGAEGGYNYKKALQLFARDMPPGRLIVKVDGQVVTDFLNHRNENLIDRLREIDDICEDPLVVAEWMPNIEDILALRERLKPYGLDHLIGLVQSIYLQKETPSSILRKLDMLERDAGQAPSP
jgi:EAL domain-containing protein (putative c-di-GMP-specific phosphodiesterase class I)